jgi:hypothetical protein
MSSALELLDMLKAYDGERIFDAPHDVEPSELAARLNTFSRGAS